MAGISMFEYNPKQSISASLHEIGMKSPEVARLADFYHEALGYSFIEDKTGMLGIGADRRLHLSAGPAKTLAYAAYKVPNAEDLRGLEQRLTAAGVSFEQSAGFESDAWLRFADPDGNLFLFGRFAEENTKLFDGIGNQPARLQHVVFASTNVERLLVFFTGVIGFTLSDRVVDDDGILRTAFLRCGSEHHSLAIFAAAENRLDHHCYEATDWGLIRDWADGFARLRIPLKWGPGRHGPGNNLFLFIHDPDGNWVEISAELEIVKPDRPVGDWPHEERTLNSWGQGFLRS